MKKTSAIISLMILLLAGCGETEKPTNTGNTIDNDQLFSEVMKIHDEAMARMGELNTLKRELQSEQMKVDSTSRLYDSLTSLVLQLERADEGMFNWMGEFKDPRTSLSQENAKVYLEGQLNMVNKVADDIDNSISAGANILTQIRKDDE